MEQFVLISSWIPLNSTFIEFLPHLPPTSLAFDGYECSEGRQAEGIGAIMKVGLKVTVHDSCSLCTQNSTSSHQSYVTYLGGGIDSHAIRPATIKDVCNICGLERIRFSETSVLQEPHVVNIPEVGILHSHCREHLKAYIALTGWTL
jgi:hypothetical protein